MICACLKSKVDIHSSFKKFIKNVSHYSADKATFITIKMSSSEFLKNETLSLTLLLFHLNFVSSTFSPNTLSRTTFQFKGRKKKILPLLLPFTKMRDNESQEEKDTAGPTLFLHPQCTNFQKKLSSY